MKTLRGRSHYWILFSLAISLYFPGTTCKAQDPFEIHVYEYETPARGGYTLEAHLNYVGIGSKTSEAPLAPANNQLHMTYELTAGITDHTSLGLMFLTGRRIHRGLEYAGWRLLPHLYVPKSWGLPVDLGLVTEFSFQRAIYEENSRRVEIRPIIEKRLKRFQLDLNPVFERALHGPGTKDGWRFEPAGRLAYDASRQFTPTLEYYSELGPLPTLAPRAAQVHEILPGGDLKLRDDLLWSLGAGIGLTAAGPRLVFKSRFEFEFGRKR